MMSALPLASARLRKLLISFLNHLLDGDLSKKSFISILYLFPVFNYDFVIYIEFTYSQLQTQQLMASQIRSCIEYLMQIYNILVLILY